MQYIYTECKLPSNGKLYKTPQVVHLRPKTIFDIKVLLNDPVFMVKSEIDTLQNCIAPEDNINVYDLVNQDVVYLLYKLRSLSDDCLMLDIKKKQYPIKISELEIKYLEEWDNKVVLPESGINIYLSYQPIKNIFNIEQQKAEFLDKYPDFVGDVTNVLSILNAIESVDGSVNKDNIRNILENLSWKDSIYLIDKIEENNKLDFGVREFVNLDIDGETLTVPLQINENFFRSTL